MNSRRRSGQPAVASLVLGTLWATLAWAAAPANVAIEGRLQTDGGGAVADGDYALTFSVYASQNSQQSLWSESVAKLAVKGGVFRHALGSVKALDPKLLASGSVWLGLRVGGDPELARSQFHGVPFALRAAVADGLACTGCVSLAALKADGDLNLGGNALKSKLISTGSVVAASISANAFVGDGSQLTGIKLPAGACPQGEAAVGIDSTGKLQCASGAAGGTLEQVSGGLLTTKYAQPVVSKTVPKDIEDFNPIGAFDEIIVPDVGTVTTLAVTVQLTNSDLTGVKLVLYDPLNAEHVLFQGGKPGKVLSETWPPSKQVSGDLSTWQGKNAKGKWRLGVIDSKFLKDNKDGKDGKLESWSINLLTNNSKQVTSTGVFLAAGGLQHQLSSGPPFACSGDSIGWMYLDSKDKRLYFCDGDWRKLLIEPLCGNKVINPGETCDDGNVNNGDGCTSKCQKNVCGDGILWPAKEECDDGNVKSGDDCSATCKNEASPIACADGTIEQKFSDVMFGCNGSFVSTNLATACAKGWHPANPNEYFTYGGKTVKPNVARWVDTAWDAKGKDTGIKNWAGHYDCSNSGGWNGLCKNSNCTWLSYTTECTLTFINHDYGKSWGCHCRGGDPKTTGRGVICVRDTSAKPRL